MKHAEILKSDSLSRVFFCVVRGQNYSALIARKLGYTQPAAVQNLVKLEAARLIKSKRDGGSIKYQVEWKAVAKMWRETMEGSLKEESFKWQKQRIPGVADKLVNDTVKAILESGLSKLAKIEDKWLVEFTEKYLTALAKSNFTFTFSDAFLWFYSYVFYPKAEHYGIRDKKVSEKLEALLLHRFEIFFYENEADLKTFLLKTTKKMDD
jgi:DNA-binding transcriptional ArsR family regulator